ncbi:hypothetical protein HRbin17_02486 [bacterium HR17]|uniref:Uncharacterized protein n=1 Tax=Candidatus Fervidibacter japonicus TaxID=2035412 RepID=A0A2H5XFJ1_9BACT|nr:hypothetical protein HRbin17_02486 [bacterium HR17]
MTWDELRTLARDELGEALFTRPDETLAFVLRSWQTIYPDRFESPLRLSEADSAPPDFVALTQQFLWQVLDEEAETAAVRLWLTLAEWLAGWQVSQQSGGGCCVE